MFTWPSRFTSAHSLEDAAAVAQALGTRLDTVPISGAQGAVGEALAPLFAGTEPGITEENIQSRLRGLLLMALSNKFGAMLLTTGNKSEMAVGYCTIYGDMNGGLGPIGDCYKTQIWALSRHANRDGVRIPEASITKAPSAELRENQTDQDSLPPYDTLDAIMRMYMEEDRSLAEIVAAGFAPADVQRVTRLIKINEYKRRQAPIGIRVTHRAFGRDWRYPITSRYTEPLE